jgi:hypothetical protein
MKYIVDKEKLLSVLGQRPALITSVQNPSESFLKSAVARNYKVIDYLTTAQKTDGVYIAWLDARSWNPFLLGKVPPGVINRLTPKMRLAKIKEHSHLIEWLPQTTVDEWRVAVQSGWMHQKYMEMMPKEALESEDIFFGLCKNSPSNIIESIPECFCTPDMVKKIVAHEWQMINNLPVNLIDNAVLRLALEGSQKEQHPQYINVSETLTYNNDTCLGKLPIWDAYTIDLAVRTSSGRNISDLPRKLVTEELCIYAATEGIDYYDLPIKNRTVLLHAVAHYVMASWKPIAFTEPVMEDPEFQTEALILGGSTAVKNIKASGYTISDKVWENALRGNADLIKEIPRTEQTNEMVDALVMTADQATIDSLSDLINLGKIKAQHAPLLIGCESPRIMGTIEKFLSPEDRKRMQGKANDNQIELDMSPGDFAKIRSFLS